MFSNSSASLTRNAIKIMYQMDSSADDEFFLPVVQVLQLQKLNCNTGSQWVVALSDSRHFLYGELSSDLHTMIHDHVIDQNAIIRVDQFSMSTWGDMRVCHVSEAHRVVPNPGYFVGNPTNIRLHVPNSNQNDEAQSLRTAFASQKFSGVDGFFSSRSTPNWQNSRRDSYHRSIMVEDVERVLTNAEKRQQHSLSDARRAELSTLAKQFENELYQRAESWEEYTDTTTFIDRLQKLARMTDSRGEVTKQNHYRLHLLRHSMTCNERICTVTPFCRDMQAVWEHVEECDGHDRCQVPFCFTARKLVNHSKICREYKCQVCDPMVRVDGCVLCEDEGRKERLGARPGGDSSQGPSEAARISTKQEYLLTLLHASLCPHEEDGECLLSPLCYDLKKVWMHIMFCTNPACQYPFCASSRALVDHYRACRDEACPVCPPVRMTRIRHGINKLTVDPDCEVASSLLESKEAEQKSQETATSDVVPSEFEVAASQAAIYDEIRCRDSREASGSDLPSNRYLVETPGPQVSANSYILPEDDPQEERSHEFEMFCTTYQQSLLDDASDVQEAGQDMI